MSAIAQEKITTPHREKGKRTGRSKRHGTERFGEHVVRLPPSQRSTTTWGANRTSAPGRGANACETPLCHFGIPESPKRYRRYGCSLRSMYATVINISGLFGKRAMTTQVLSVRVNDEERALLESASDLAHTSLSDFIRRKALDAAEADILDRRIVTIPAKDWEAFEAWANRPPEAIAGLKDLATKAPTWQK
jgi:uncharacterized protein (DUF1778 family)